MIAHHPDIAATAALGAYQERVEQAHINHIIDRAVHTNIGPSRTDGGSPLTIMSAC